MTKEEINGQTFLMFSQEEFAEFMHYTMAKSYLSQPDEERIEIAQGWVDDWGDDNLDKVKKFTNILDKVYEEDHIRMVDISDLFK